MAGIRDIARYAGVKHDVVSDVFEAVLQLVRGGEQVKILGFGSFELKKFPGRTIVSPVINDGKPTKFKSSFRISFKQTDQCKRRLNTIKIKKKKRWVDDRD